MIRAVRFTKMSGAGNDFIVLDAEAAGVLGPDRSSWVRAVCRRGLSVGADGVLFVSAEGTGKVRVQFLNPDGSEAFCGNGTRCAARFAHVRGLCGAEVTLATVVGDVPAVIDGAGVRLTLPPPRDLGLRALDALGSSWSGRLIDAGVPHYVIPVDDVETVPLASIGPVLRRHPALGASGANVDVISRASDGAFHVRTWERGVESETLACGTGAVATALAARLNGGPATIRILPASGVPLSVTIPGDARTAPCAVLSGDARFVFEGELSEEAG